MRRATSRLILLRHGQSEWNGASGFGPARFTGWVDVALTPRGEAEAAAAGALLRSQAPPMAVDAAFTSELRRAAKTAELCLPGAAVARDARLNERHYGALQGVRKDDPGLLATPLAHSTQTQNPLTASELEKIRRSMREAPPAMSASHPHYDAKAPPTESLADCQRRVLACFDERVAPAVRGGRTVLVAAHANTLRALIAALDGVPDALVPKIFVPNAVPCVPSRRLAAITDGDDVAVAASAGAILAELDEDGDGTISLAEFEERAEQACRQFVPSPVGLGDAATRGYAGPGRVRVGRAVDGGVLALRAEAPGTQRPGRRPQAGEGGGDAPSRRRRGADDAPDAARSRRRRGAFRGVRGGAAAWP
ncbi:hypothetical protein JL721_250 [Aureococcus anophagefferens]|nr:hypothetical protein JL721_250 [Aureococcus anophagefferens]